MRRAVVVAFAIFILAAAASGAPPDAPKPVAPKAKASHLPAIDESLPVLGTELGPLPAGPGKATAEAACLKCHSADILRQQRLNEKQWAANVTKMMGWGADVPDAQKEELLAYLVKSFGPDNDRFKPVVTRPAGR